MTQPLDGNERRSLRPEENMARQSWRERSARWHAHIAHAAGALAVAAGAEATANPLHWPLAGRVGAFAAMAISGWVAARHLITEAVERGRAEGLVEARGHTLPEDTYPRPTHRIWNALLHREPAPDTRIPRPLGVITEGEGPSVPAVLPPMAEASLPLPAQPAPDYTANPWRL